MGEKKYGTKTSVGIMRGTHKREKLLTVVINYDLSHFEYCRDVTRYHCVLVLFDTQVVPTNATIRFQKSVSMLWVKKNFSGRPRLFSRKLAACEPVKDTIFKNNKN